MTATWARPRALRPGDLVAVCAPSGPVDPERLATGVAELESLGFRTRVPEGVLERTRFTAGSRERRGRELEELFADRDVAGIFCARGGAGAGGLLGRLDATRLVACPKVFVGYSDVTALHLLLNRRRVVSFHGPMVARDLAGASYHRASLLHALTGTGEPYRAPAGMLEPLLPGRAEGTLLGGCLSLLAAAAGTPWAFGPIDGEDALLFLEDVDEPAYRIDRMLQQLRDSGAFGCVRGVLLGTLPGCRAPRDGGFGVGDVIRDALADLAIPVALGLPSGHTGGDGITLPFGVRARLAVAEGGADFEVLERAVVTA